MRDAAGTLTLVIGGSGSGKSALAETLLAGADPARPRIYIATMNPSGPDAERRIAAHRAARANKGFTSVERYTDVGATPFPAGSAVLLECLGTWLANEMFGSPAPAALSGRRLGEGVAALRDRAAACIIVTNDVHDDGVRYPAATERYRTELADANRRVAALADTVIETVCGIPLVHKRPTEASPCVQS